MKIMDSFSDLPYHMPTKLNIIRILGSSLLDHIFKGEGLVLENQRYVRILEHLNLNKVIDIFVWF